MVVKKIEFVKKPDQSMGAVFHTLMEQLKEHKVIKSWGYERDIDPSCIIDDPDNIGRTTIDTKAVEQLPITYYVEFLDEKV